VAVSLFVDVDIVCQCLVLREREDPVDVGWEKDSAGALSEPSSIVGAVALSDVVQTRPQSALDQTVSVSSAKAADS
jgi:hypothetical protein